VSEARDPAVSSLPKLNKVARTRAWGDTRIEEEPMPRLEPGDALVRVEACGLCGSDAHKWYVEKKAPIVLGHEPAGVVVATGAGCMVKEGDRVFVHHHVPCGKCRACERGIDSSCSLFRTSKLDPGGFATHFRVPRENVERDVLVLPEGISWLAATFIEPLACALRGANKLRITRDDVALVVGLGAQGMLNSFALRAKGVKRILGSDLQAHRRDHARSIGAIDDGIDATGDVREQVLALTKGVGVDHAIVGPTASAVIETAFSTLAPGGTCVVFSPMNPASKITVGGEPLYFGERTLTSSYSCGPRETREALALLARPDCPIPVRSLVSHGLGLDGVGMAIDRTARAEGDWLKAIIWPHATGPVAPDGTL
jgi:L-iditol 2-dehydrogenase